MHSGSIEDLLGGDQFRSVLTDVKNPYYTQQHYGSFTNPIITLSQNEQQILKTYTIDIVKEHQNTNNDFPKINCKIAKKYKRLFKKTEVFYMYKQLCIENYYTNPNILREFFQTKSSRSHSGVTVFAIFTHPFWKNNANGVMTTFSCKYNCRYCPNMPGHPRSYIPGEPGNDRAQQVGYDVVKQIHTRANGYNLTGHINDKAEVIILGGTWHSYPEEYRIMFVTQTYYAFNTIGDIVQRPMLSMIEEIKLNQVSECRVIGLTIETRPDQINIQELILLRKMGVTRVQLGIQHTNDRLLTRIQRKCKAIHGINAIKMLKDCGFKVDIHLMPDLPKPFLPEFEKNNKLLLNSDKLRFTKDDIDWLFDSIGEDLKMFNIVFYSGEYMPDQVKIYPCEVTDWTGIKTDFENGSHIPYGTRNTEGTENPLFELLIYVKSNFPEYCRINRLVRDIPEGYILAGTSDTNGRQMIENLMKQRGLKCSCIRCREIKKKKVDISKTSLKISKYRASGGDEYFLQYVTDADELIGFLRLRISDNAGMIKNCIAFQELVNTAMIRELHVYGEVVQVNRTGQTISEPTIFEPVLSQQHTGFGTRLMQNAIYLAHTLGYKKISVISGEGVKPYYKRFGFYDGEYFMLKNIDTREFANYQYITQNIKQKSINIFLLLIVVCAILIALYIAFIYKV